MGSKKMLLSVTCFTAISLLGACAQNTDHRNEQNYSNARNGVTTDNVHQMSTKDLSSYNKDVRALYDGYYKNMANVESDQDLTINRYHNYGSLSDGNNTLTGRNDLRATDRTGYMNNGSYYNYQNVAYDQMNRNMHNRGVTYPRSVNYYTGIGNGATGEYMTPAQYNTAGTFVNKMNEHEAKLAEEIKVKVESLTEVDSALTFVTDKDVYIAVKSPNGTEETIRTDVKESVKDLVDKRHLHIGIGKSFIGDMKKILTDLNDGKPIQYEKAGTLR